MNERKEKNILSLCPICLRLLNAMKINKGSTSSPVRRTVPLHTAAFESKSEEPICQQIIATNVVLNRGNSSSPIRVSPAVRIEEEIEEVEEVKLRHLYDLATWRMFHRIAAARRSDSGSDSLEVSVFDMNAQIIEDEDLTSQSRRLALRSARKVSFSISNQEKCFSLDEFPEERQLNFDENDEGVFHLEMES